MRAYAVIDIGGTAIKYGCATEEGQFLEKASRPTRAGAVSIPDVVLAIVKDMAARHELAGIAIDTAGIVRPGEDGEIVFAGETTFPGYSGTKLGRIVRETMQLPVLVENDVNAAALGEVWRGAARGASSAFMITVGTNLGGCFVQQGRIWHGASFSAGEPPPNSFACASGMKDQVTASSMPRLASARRAVPEKSMSLLT